ncbi:MAG: hypothetical protein GVY32_03340 [Gammaproteobacteria bacterium]|jgi:hypothetical protein|nr:hypothetical protein [Gammaproteobacteria bacterium]
MVTVPRVNPQAGNIAGAAVNPVAGDTGAVGRGLQQAGNQLTQLADTVHRSQVKADRLKANKREQEFLTQLQQATAELDPLADDYDAQVETAINETIEATKAETEFRTGEVQSRFAARLENLGQAQVREAFSAREAALNDQALRDYDEQRQQLMANIAADPQGADVFLAEFAADVRETYAGVLDQSQLETLAKETAENALVQEALGFAEAGNMRTARAVIDDNAGDLDPSMARSAKATIRGIESRKRAEFARATAGELADIRIAVSRAETPEEIAAARERVNDANERGLFRGRQGTRAQLTIGLDKQQEAAREEAAAREDRNNRYLSGTGAVDQRDADAMWEEVTANATGEGEQLDPQQTIDMVADFAQQTGFVPSPIKQNLQRAERMLGEQQLAFAAQQYQTIRNVAPQVDVGLDKGSAVRQTAALVDIGTFDTHAEAATYLANLSTRDQNVRKARRDAFEEEAGVEDLTDAQIAGRINLNPLGTRVPGGRQVVQLPEGARQEYVNTFKQNYLVSGDVDAAQAATDKYFQERWGVSRITGQDQAMRHPPERFVPNFDSLLERPEVRTRLIQDDLRQSLEDANIRVAGEDVEADDLPRFSLQADERTEAEVAAGEVPTYRVYARDEAAGGAMLPVTVIRRDGAIEPMRYTPPSTKQEVTSSQAWRDAVDRESERIEQMRERRLNREETGAPDLREKAAANREARAQERRALDVGDAEAARERVTEVLRDIPGRLPKLDQDELQRLEDNVQPFAPPGVTGKMIVDWLRNVGRGIRERSEERTRENQ